MTTRLERPLAREILIDGQPYKVVLSAAGLRLTQKGYRKGVEVGWGDLNANGQDAVSDVDGNPPPSVSHRAGLDPTELARAVIGVEFAIARLRRLVAQSDASPSSVRDDLERAGGNRMDGEFAGWFVEPLLTPQEVAALFRVSTRAVPHLGLRSVLIGGAERYRRSEVREFLARQERRAGPVYHGR